MVPITKNPLGVRRQIDFVEASWVVERDPSSPRPQPSSLEVGNVTQYGDIDVGEELTEQAKTVTKESGRFTVVEAPPPPIKKKRERET